MASSTTIPRTKIKVNSESILIETSKKGKNQIAPKNDIGIPNDIQKASLGLINKDSTNITNKRPMPAFFNNKSNLPFKYLDSSFHISNSIPDGSSLDLDSTYDFTLSAISRAF